MGLMSAHRTLETSSYAIIKLPDFNLVVAVSGLNKDEWRPWVPGRGRFNIRSSVLRKAMDRVARNMATRAGIVFLDKEVYDDMAYIMMQYRNMLSPILTCIVWHRSGTLFEGMDSFDIREHDVPPRFENAAGQRISTIIPRENVEAASQLNYAARAILHDKPYDDGAWLPADGNSIEDEIAEATALYSSPFNNAHEDSSSKESSSYWDSEIDEEDESDDESFSVYIATMIDGFSQ